MNKNERFNIIRNIKLDLSNVKPNKMEEGQKGLEGACWEGYEAIGLKPDGSPNCVPIKEEQSKVKKEGFVIPKPEGNENEETYISRCISEIIDEYTEDGQAYAVCKGEWDK